MDLCPYAAIIWLRLGVKNVHGLLLKQSTSAHAIRKRPLRALIESVYNFGTLVIMRDKPEKFAIELAKVTLLSTSEFHGIREHGIENWLEFSR
jgi:hypothetical protein